MRITYPSPEPVVTPRAREGLRAVVPTIFPPSTVNRGESVRVWPPEPGRERRGSTKRHTSPDGLVQEPKKRGPKPRLPFKVSREGPTLVLSEPHNRRAEEEQADFTSTQPAAPQGDVGRSSAPGLMKHRLHQNRVHTHKHNHRHNSNTHFRTHQPHQQAIHSRQGTGTDPVVVNRTTVGSGHMAHFKHKSKSNLSQLRTELSSTDKPAFLDRPSPAPPVGDLDRVKWRPSLANVEKVLVTDVTSNFLTVTIKESSTSQGFFKDKS